MNRLSSHLAACVVLALVGCGSDSPSDDDDDSLTEQEKAEQRDELTSTYVGTWEGDLVPQVGAQRRFTLVVEAASGVSPKCGTVELGAGVGTRCITIYQTAARATLTTDDGAFTGLAVDGTLSNVGARFELPNAGFVSLEGNGGSFSYGEGAASGTLQATRK